MVCCGKEICDGCIESLTREYCPFCNTHAPDNNEERINRLFDRVERYNDAEAMNILSSSYRLGRAGLPVDYSKAVELLGRASEFGCVQAHLNLGTMYSLGTGVQDVDQSKAVHHWQNAAMMGDDGARFNLGVFEEQNGNMERAMKHYNISAKSGRDSALENVKRGFRMELVTKDDFANTLCCHQTSQDEIRSAQRDRARAIPSRTL